MVGDAKAADDLGDDALHGCVEAVDEDAVRVHDLEDREAVGDGEAGLGRDVNGSPRKIT